MGPEKAGFPEHLLFGDSVYVGSVKQVGRRLSMPPYLYNLRFHALHRKRPWIQVHLLHNIGSDTGYHNLLGLLEAWVSLWPFPATWR